MFAGSGLSGGVVGLMLTYTLSLSNVFQVFVRQSTEVENQVYRSNFIDLGYCTGLIPEVLCHCLYFSFKMEQVVSVMACRFLIILLQGD